jgi:hypothetical protein
VPKPAPACNVLGGGSGLYGAGGCGLGGAGVPLVAGGVGGGPGEAGIGGTVGIGGGVVGFGGTVTCGWQTGGFGSAGGTLGGGDPQFTICEHFGSAASIQMGTPVQGPLVSLGALAG